MDQRIRNIIEPIALRFPSIEQPPGKHSLRQKLKWTVGVLFIYFALTNVAIFGLSLQGGSDLFGQFRSVLAGSQGSILQLGIGPIVTASIILQLMSGVDLLGLDLNDPRDQQLYQGLQKILVLLMVVITGLPFAFSPQFLPPSQAVASTLGIGILGVQLLIFVQIAAGGAIIMYLDEVVSNWGVGSGIGLFIIAGVSQRMIGGVFSRIIPNWYSIITGNLTAPIFTAGWFQELLITRGRIIPIVTTIGIFAVVVYAESTRVGIPIVRQNSATGRGRYPVKLIYASVMPLILVRAVQANIQLAGRVLDSQLGAQMPTWLGRFSPQGQATSGLFYYLSPIQQPGQWQWWAGGPAATHTPIEIFLRISVDLGIMVIGGAIFALFWVNTTGMSSRDVAGQLKRGGFQIPGWRTNEKIIAKRVDRYIPYITVIGGALVGVLAVGANMLGTIGGVTGTGLLLSVSITYKLYESIQQEALTELGPRARAFFGS